MVIFSFCLKCELVVSEVQVSLNLGTCIVRLERVKMKPNALERKIGLAKAKKLYEQNVERNSDENNAFERLAVIYRSQGRIADEIRVCEQAIAFYEHAVFVERLRSRLPTLNSFTRRLKAARSILCSQQSK